MCRLSPPETNPWLFHCSVFHGLLTLVLVLCLGVQFVFLFLSSEEKALTATPPPQSAALVNAPAPFNDLALPTGCAVFGFFPILG